MNLERITPYKDGGSIKDRIDEIVRGEVHVEMMDEHVAWMRIGREIFWIQVDKKKLVIRYSETWPEPRSHHHRGGDE